MKPSPNNNEARVGQDDFLVSKTDLQGRITYCNREFMKIAGFDEKSLLGKPHNIVRHPDMPKAVFKVLWSYVQRKEEVFAFVKNMTATGGYYWVYANVTASLNAKGDAVGYFSVRRKPSDNAISIVSKLYSTLLDKERQGGVDASMKYVEDLLAEHNVTYNQFIVGLQNGNIRI